MGDDIVKVFGGKLYREWIIDVDEDEEQGDVLTVKFEDRDGDDLDTKYYVYAIKLYQDTENGVIDEWTIVNEYDVSNTIVLVVFEFDN